MSRRGLTFKRCGKCGGRVEGKSCSKCGSDSFSWSYVVDVAEPGEKRKQRSKAGFKTRKEAQAALNDILGSLQRGLVHRPVQDDTRWLPAGRMAPGDRGHRSGVNAPKQSAAS